MDYDKRYSWNALEEHANFILASEPEVLDKVSSAPKTDFQQSACGITLDYSGQWITQDTISLLCDLADACKLKEKISALMTGEKINTSENRSALHTALRVLDYQPLWIDGRDVMAEIFSTRAEMESISTPLREAQWLGYTGKPIKHIVNIGMGGSDLGARLCLSALCDDVTPSLSFHFISDVDPGTFKRVVGPLTPETTLFIVSSKSFTTKETLFNLKLAVDWVGDAKRISQHFIAVTASPDKASSLGIQHVLPIWDWVGGRYSSCSAINLITMIAIGPERFRVFLAGAHAMDLQFKNIPFELNLPVLSALLGIWNNNFIGIHTLLMLVYSHQLEQFVPYLQQLDMESNGKQIDKHNMPVTYATGPIIWGGHGSRAQHSYYQLLCQGTHRVAIDFISIRSFDDCLVNAFCRAKQRVLAKGIQDDVDHSKQISIQTPMNHLRLNECSPYTLGALISLYEHKIYTQGVIWNINSFDQPGVELAKRNEKEWLERV